MQPHPDRIKNGTIKAHKKASWDTLHTHQQYTKLYAALKDLEDFNVRISVPEFVFIGFQSSGKTSAVSQAAKLAVGTMKHGTASRCPTRFKLICNPQQSKAIIKVNGELCRDEDDLTKKTLQITKQYEEQQIFSKDMIEVRIESDQVPELTFLDLPGLIKSDAEKWKVAKKQLDELTAHFLHDINPDGSYRYIPIFVREPVDLEHDTHFEVKYIDQLVERYGYGRKKRIDWRKDTLFIVNKFDKQMNRSPAYSLIEYMKYCANYGRTVLTIMNAKDTNTANMTQKELNRFVDGVQKDEQDKWRQILTQFRKMDDENLTELEQLIQEMCGVPKMNQILSERMCEIVKRILPQIQEQLDAAETEKRAEITSIMKQIELCNPQQLKRQCLQFNNKFLMFSKMFYDGRCLKVIDKKWNKSWSKEMDDFHAISHTNDTHQSTQWQYEISSSKLQSLLLTLHKKRRAVPLLRILRMKLAASSAINRMIDAWQSQVALMSFPRYTDEDLVNLCDGFMATRQCNLWTIVRNVVLHSITHLSDAILHLAEMMRYKLKENADIIFECTVRDQFGAFNVNKSSVMKLLERTRRDYKKEIDRLVDEFIALSCCGPRDKAHILDRLLCEETINIGKLVNVLLDPQNKSKFVHKDNATSAPPPPPPKQRRLSQLSSGSSSPSLEQSSTDLVGRKKKRKKKKKTTDDEDDFSALPMLRRNTQFVDSKKKSIDIVYDKQKHDGIYYEAIYGQALHFPVEYSSSGYDIALIRHLSYVFWANIKQLTVRDAIQKLTKNVISSIKQQDARISNAIQCGVDQYEVQSLIDALVEKTGVDVVALERLIRERSTVKLEKCINDLDNEELEEIYGVDRGELIQQKDIKIKSLREYKKLKAKTLEKIYQIKNNQLDDIHIENEDDDVLDNEELDDID